MSENGSSYKNVARVTGRFGKAGEVKVEPIDGLPFLLSEGMLVYLTPPKMTGLRSARVVSIRAVGDAYGVKFEGCDSLEKAFDLEGRLCLVDCADIEDYLEEEDFTFLIGMPVEDVRLGFLGDVTEIMENPLQALLIIGNEENPERYLIPFVEEFVVSVGEDRIETEIPDDLANLNEGE